MALTVAPIAQELDTVGPARCRLVAGFATANLFHPSSIRVP
jgi:hypothetical protein